MDTLKIETITLFKASGAWMAQSNDPQILDLFGTDTIATAFIDRASADVVKREISRLNPNANVYVKKGV